MHHVVAGDHAEVAVARFGRVNEERRRPGARERGSDLAPDVPRLADAADHDSAAAREDHPQRVEEAFVEARGEGGDGLRLDLQYLAREPEGAIRHGRLIGMSVAIRGSRYHPEKYSKRLRRPDRGGCAQPRPADMNHALELVLVLLASAVLVVVVFRTLHLPPLLGYLIVGVAIGPHALGWIAENRNTAYLGEFGVVFLMFSLGLEFSLPQLMQMRRLVLGLGGLQVVLTTVVFTALIAAAGAAWQSAFTVGAALAMSSTAIVVRMLAERMQTETPHGRETIGVLLAQDLAVVPLLVAAAGARAARRSDLADALAVAALKAAVILAVVLLARAQAHARRGSTWSRSAARTSSSSSTCS